MSIQCDILDGAGQNLLRQPASASRPRNAYADFPARSDEQLPASSAVWLDVQAVACSCSFFFFLRLFQRVLFEFHESFLISKPLWPLKPDCGVITDWEQLQHPTPNGFLTWASRGSVIILALACCYRLSAIQVSVV